MPARQLSLRPPTAPPTKQLRILQIRVWAPFVYPHPFSWLKPLAPALAPVEPPLEPPSLEPPPLEPPPLEPTPPLVEPALGLRMEVLALEPRRVPSLAPQLAWLPARPLWRPPRTHLSLNALLAPPFAPSLVPSLAPPIEAPPLLPPPPLAQCRRFCRRRRLRNVVYRETDDSTGLADQNAAPM